VTLRRGRAALHPETRRHVERAGAGRIDHHRHQHGANPAGQSRPAKPHRSDFTGWCGRRAIGAELRAGLPPDLRLERAGNAIRPRRSQRRLFAESDGDEPAGAGGGHVPDLQRHHFSVVQRRALLGMLASPGRQPPRTVDWGVWARRCCWAWRALCWVGFWDCGWDRDWCIWSPAPSTICTTCSASASSFIEPGSLAKGAALGLLATLAAAWLPAREAANAPPGLVLSRLSGKPLAGRSAALGLDRTGAAGRRRTDSAVFAFLAFRVSPVCSC
jgi:hypothetical protein